MFIKLRLFNFLLISTTALVSRHIAAAVGDVLTPGLSFSFARVVEAFLV